MRFMLQRIPHTIRLRKGKSMPSKIAGGCRCGACRYSTDSAPINIRVCHCRRCQRATGAAFFARVLVPLDSVQMQGPVGWFDGGTGLRRGFCTACGSPLFSERISANTLGLALGGLDDPGRFPLTACRNSPKAPPDRVNIIPPARGLH
jgi:hypothetical protein